MTTTFTGGNHALARADYDEAPCERCGILRYKRPDRPTLCPDCRAQQAADDQAWLAFHPVPALSDEDRAWCIKAANTGLQIAWERANRAGGDERLQRQIERLVA